MRFEMVRSIIILDCAIRGNSGTTVYICVEKELEKRKKVLQKILMVATRKNIPVPITWRKMKNVNPTDKKAIVIHSDRRNTVSPSIK